LATLIDDGWLHLTNGTDTMKLACKRVTWDWKWNPSIVHYAGGGHYGIDLQEQALRVTAQMVLFGSLSDAETFLSTLRTWQDSGTFSLSVSYDGTNYIKLDGTNSTFTVVSKGPGKVEKISPASGTIYAVGQVMFEQAG